MVSRFGDFEQIDSSELTERHVRGGLFPMRTLVINGARTLYPRVATACGTPEVGPPILFTIPPAGSSAGPRIDSMLPCTQQRQHSGRPHDA